MLRSLQSKWWIFECWVRRGFLFLNKIIRDLEKKVVLQQVRTVYLFSRAGSQAWDEKNLLRH